MFDLAASISVGVVGEDLAYTRGGKTNTVRILIERNLQIVDEQTGAGQYINAAVFANADFPYDKPLDGDTITAHDRIWKVLRKVSDDGHVSTVEIK